MNILNRLNKEVDEKFNRQKLFTTKEEFLKNLSFNQISFLGHKALNDFTEDLNNFRDQYSATLHYNYSFKDFGNINKKDEIGFEFEFLFHEIIWGNCYYSGNNLLKIDILIYKQRPSYFIIDLLPFVDFPMSPIKYFNNNPLFKKDIWEKTPQGHLKMRTTTNHTIDKYEGDFPQVDYIFILADIFDNIIEYFETMIKDYQEYKVKQEEESGNIKKLHSSNLYNFSKVINY
jgi:hypothetical protein